MDQDVSEPEKDLWCVQMKGLNELVMDAMAETQAAIGNFSAKRQGQRRILHAKEIAFGAWKDVIDLQVRSRRRVLRVLNRIHNRTISKAFFTWTTLCKQAEMTAQVQMHMEKLHKKRMVIGGVHMNEQ